MADNDDALHQESDSSRSAEWDRLDAEDAGRQADAAPSGDDAAAGADEATDTGQASSPPASPAAETPPAGSEAPADDIWKDAPEPLRAAYRAAEEARIKAEAQVSTQTGRLRSATQQLTALDGEVKSLREKVKPADKEAETGPILTEEAKTTLRDEYPDVAAPLLDLIGGLEKKLATLESDNASRAEQDEVARQLETQRFLAEEEQALAGAHPDWRQVTADEKFTTWAQSQPRYVKEALIRNGDGIVDAVEASEIVQRYKDSLGTTTADPLAARRAAQLSGGRVPAPRTTTATPSTTTDKQGEWARLDALDRQRAGAQR
jgi:hypothetical protein